MNIRDLMFDIEICYTTNMFISFDNTYEIHPKVRRLDAAIGLAHSALKLHNFSVADIIDANTGEVLAIIKNTED